MNKIVEILLGVVVLLGAIIAVISALGLIRLQDVYLRSHAATKSATLGVLFILSGVFLYFWIIQHHFSLKLLLGILFVFLTSPVAGHLNARAAYRSGVALWKGSVKDALKEVRKDERHEGEKERI
jgi:multicomponent Na+:H+ antiporter subunit G